MAKKKTSPLRVVRICVAAVVLTLFILLFTDPGGAFHKAMSALPKLQFWPAVLALNAGIVLLWIVLAFVFGRVYCSVACPLGILQDLIYRLRTSGPKKRRFTQKWTKPLNILRYCILAIFIVGSALLPGAFADLIEPYSIFGRMVSSPLARALPIAAVSLATLALIVFLVWKWGRIWCNTICPVGSILSIPSRHSLFAPVINLDKCVSCGLCGKACRAGCIDTKNHKVDTSRCVLCFDCLDNCHDKAIDFKFRFRPSADLSGDGNVPGETVPPSAHKRGDHEVVGPEREARGGFGGHLPRSKSAEGRRAFLTASAIAVGTVAAKAADNADLFGVLEKKQAPRRVTKLVPPGSGSLKHFEDHCVACQLCVDVCPNKVLRPSMDPAHFMQPEMGFEKGYCRPECTACSEVCPASAISPITPEQKSSTSIGHAIFNPEVCVVLTDGVKCGNCARHCPAGAISMIKRGKLEEGLRIPSINPERCIGCGRCEHVCPSRPVSAIYVEGNKVHREL